MTSCTRHKRVLAAYPLVRGFAFVVFEGGCLSVVDWGVREARASNRNAVCLRHLASVFALRTPDILILQDMSERGTRRSLRIQDLNGRFAEHAEEEGVLVRYFSRAQVLERFGPSGAVSKQDIASMIAKHVPAFRYDVPAMRKPWMSGPTRMGIFDAAALAWTFFQDDESTA